MTDSGESTGTFARNETLLKQLERSRFERSLEVSESLAEKRALLTAMELERLNLILIGKELGSKVMGGTGYNPWREEPATVKLPSGRVETMSVIDNPKLLTRDKLHRATEMSEAGHVIDAAVELYCELVLSHCFKDANRRTAVLASHYFLKRYGVALSGLALHEIGLGDLREPGQKEALKETIHQMAKFAAKRG
jgi:hypothetical protein